MKNRDNVEELRNHLEDFYGTAMFAGFGQAVIDLGEIQDADRDELIDIAKSHDAKARRLVREIEEEER